MDSCQLLRNTVTVVAKIPLEGQRNYTTNEDQVNRLRSPIPESTLI
jgi:hypothetical protein